MYTKVFDKPDMFDLGGGWAKKMFLRIPGKPRL